MIFNLLDLSLANPILIPINVLERTISDTLLPSQSTTWELAKAIAPAWRNELLDLRWPEWKRGFDFCSWPFLTRFFRTVNPCTEKYWSMVICLDDPLTYLILCLFLQVSYLLRFQLSQQMLFLMTLFKKDLSCISYSICVCLCKELCTWV